MKIGDHVRVGYQFCFIKDYDKHLKAGDIFTIININEDRSAFDTTSDRISFMSWDMKYFFQEISLYTECLSLGE